MAENFLSKKYLVNVKLSAEKIPVNAKIIDFEKFATEKIFGKKISEPITEISKLILDKKSVIVGEIFDIELREFKTGSSAITFSLADDSDGILCKKFFTEKSRSKADELKNNLREGMNIKILGAVKYDDYLKENIFMFDSMEEIKISDTRTDNAEIKRTELHAHTTMSTMDAVISAEKLITTAANWNWSAIAITDHGVIQAFPEAAQTVSKLAKQGKNIKVIYGLEGYLNVEENQKSGYHIIILAKNKIGLSNLYKLISISQLKYFTRTTPRIPKNILSEMREGLIIGSACEAGELIRSIVAGKSDTELEEIANFYDYLEIQPFHNNDFLIRSKDFPNINSDEDLININKKVAELAQKLNKPLVATCDVHFLNPNDSIYRAILMNGKGFTDADKQPPLYLRTTEEMLKEFDYLDEKIAYDAVVTNPNKIAESVEILKPIPDGLYSPAILGADEEIRETSYKRAKYLYGENRHDLNRN